MTGDVQNIQLTNPGTNRTLTFAPDGNNTVITAYENGKVVERVSIDQNASPERVKQLAISMRNGSSTPAPTEDTQSVAVTIDEGETTPSNKKDEKDKKDKKKDDKKDKNDKKDKSTNGVKTNMACIGLLCAVLYNLV